MSRSRFKRPEPFGKAGLTVAILALVLALVGGAYAAGGLTKSQEKQVTKIAKKFAGKPGANGTNGATGPAGANGTNGTNGAPGKNGKEGSEGKEGSPWTAGGTLPKGSTETGTWTAGGVAGQIGLGTPAMSAAISFPIPLATALDAAHVHYLGKGATHTTGTGNLTAGSKEITNVATTSGTFAVGEEISGPHIPSGTTITKVLSETLELSAAVEAGGTATGVALTADLPAGCSGNVDNPVAKEGNFCIFTAEENNQVIKVIPTPDGKLALGTSTAGSVLIVLAKSTELFVAGTWAVTAE